MPISKKIDTAVILIFLIGMANAYNINYQLMDINTKNNIVGVLVFLDNGTYSNITYTNGQGLTYANARGENHEFIAKLGYFSQNNTLNLTADQNRIIYLNPISQDGIVRLRFQDLTYSGREFCIYYSNGRMEGCYRQNDTIQLIVNQNYILKPQIKSTDIMLSPNNVKKLSGYYFGMIWPIALAIGLFIMIVYVIRRGSKNARI